MPGARRYQLVVLSNGKSLNYMGGLAEKCCVQCDVCGNFDFIDEFEYLNLQCLVGIDWFRNGDWKASYVVIELTRRSLMLLSRRD